MSRGKPFAKGYDSRRHILTYEERSRGFDNAIKTLKRRGLNAYEWLLLRVRCSAPRKRMC